MIARYMQTKAQAAGRRKRWATDTENVGQTFVKRRMTMAEVTPGRAGEHRKRG